MLEFLKAMVDLDKTNLKVLIVDDDVDIVELMDEEFRSSGYETLTALSGNEAIKILDKNKIDIVISDYKMPNGDGMSLLTYVNNIDKDRPVFYFVSGQSDVSSDECVRAGALRFFTKPFDLDKLIREIEEDLVL